MAQNAFLETNRFCPGLRPWLAGSATKWSMKCRVLTPRARAWRDFTRGHDRQIDIGEGERERRRVRLRLRKVTPWRETRTPASVGLRMTCSRHHPGKVSLGGSGCGLGFGLRSGRRTSRSKADRLSGERGQMQTLSRSSSVPPGGGGTWPGVPVAGAELP